MCMYMYIYITLQYLIYCSWICVLFTIPNCTHFRYLPFRVRHDWDFWSRSLFCTRRYEAWLNRSCSWWISMEGGAAWKPSNLYFVICIWCQKRLIYMALCLYVSFAKYKPTCKISSNFVELCLVFACLLIAFRHISTHSVMVTNTNKIVYFVSSHWPSTTSLVWVWCLCLWYLCIPNHKYHCCVWCMQT